MQRGLEARKSSAVLLNRIGGSVPRSEVSTKETGKVGRVSPLGTWGLP